MTSLKKKSQICRIMTSVDSNIFSAKDCSTKEEMIYKIYWIFGSEKLRQTQKKHLNHRKEEESGEFVIFFNKQQQQQKISIFTEHKSMFSEGEFSGILKETSLINCRSPQLVNLLLKLLQYLNASLMYFWIIFRLSKNKNSDFSIFLHSSAEIFYWCSRCFGLWRLKQKYTFF